MTSRTALWYGLTSVAPAVLFACGIWLSFRTKDAEMRLIYFSVALGLAAGLSLVMFYYRKRRERVQSARWRHLNNAAFFATVGAGYLVIGIRSLKHAPNAWPVLIVAAASLLQGVHQLRRAYTIKEAQPSTTS